MFCQKVQIDEGRDICYKVNTGDFETDSYICKIHKTYRNKKCVAKIKISADGSRQFLRQN